MPVAAHIAPIAALERTIEVMQANLETELADSTIAVTDLPLPAPGDSDYYLVLESDEALVREQTGELGVYVWQAQPLPTGVNETTIVSAGPSQSSETVDVLVSVMVAARQRQHPEISRLSKALTPNDVMVQRIHRYLGAVKLTLFKHVCNETSFFSVDVVDDFLPQAIYDAKQNIERIYGTVTVRIKTLINKTYST